MNYYRESYYADEYYTPDPPHPNTPPELLRPDPVFRPSYYDRYTIEPATFIAANKLPFDVGAIIKYVCRYDAKNGKEDIRKAIRFAEMLLERVEREERVKAGEDPKEVWKVTL